MLLRSQTKRRGASFYSLPTELHMQILSEADFTDHHVLCSVCRLWRDIIFDPHFKLRHHFTTEPRDYTKVTVHITFGGLQYGKVEMWPAILNDDNEIIVENTPFRVHRDLQQVWRRVFIRAPWADAGREEKLVLDRELVDKPERIATVEWDRKIHLQRVKYTSAAKETMSEADKGPSDHRRAFDDDPVFWPPPRGIMMKFTVARGAVADQNILYYKTNEYVERCKRKLQEETEKGESDGKLGEEWNWTVRELLETCVVKCLMDDAKWGLISGLKRVHEHFLDRTRKLQEE